MRGEKLFVAEPIVNLGMVEAEHPRDVTFRVVNRTSQAYQIIGCTTSCGCTTAQPLPVTIPAEGSTSFTLQFAPQAGRSEPVDVRVFTDCPTKPELLLRITAQAAKNPSTATSPSEHASP